MSARKKGKKIEGKYKLIIYSDDKNVIENVHSCLVNDGSNFIGIHDESGDNCYCVDIDWDDENLLITCDYDSDLEFQ